MEKFTKKFKKCELYPISLSDYYPKAEEVQWNKLLFISKHKFKKNFELLAI
jgi:hypothetical protein